MERKEFVKKLNSIINSINKECEDIDFGLGIDVGTNGIRGDFFTLDDDNIYYTSHCYVRIGSVQNLKSIQYSYDCESNSSYDIAYFYFVFNDYVLEVEHEGFVVGDTLQVTSLDNTYHDLINTSKDTSRLDQYIEQAIKTNKKNELPYQILEVYKYKPDETTLSFEDIFVLMKEYINDTKVQFLLMDIALFWDDESGIDMVLDQVKDTDWILQYMCHYESVNEGLSSPADIEKTIAGVVKKWNERKKK